LPRKTVCPWGVFELDVHAPRLRSALPDAVGPDGKTAESTHLEVYHEHVKKGCGHHWRVPRHCAELVKAFRERDYALSQQREAQASDDPDVLTVVGDIATLLRPSPITEAWHASAASTRCQQRRHLYRETLYKYTAEDYAAITA